MSLTPQDLAYYKNMVRSVCPSQMTKIQWSVFNKLITRKKESFESMAKELKMKVVHFDSAAMVASYKIKKFLEKQGLTEEESQKVVHSMLGN